MSIKTEIEWVCCTEKFPDENHFYRDKVLVTNGRDYDLAFVENNIFYDMGGDEISADITHWAHIPELEFE